MYCERKETPAAVDFFHDRLTEWATQRGQTHDVGHQLQPAVSKLKMFPDVTVKVLAVPFSPGWVGRECRCRCHPRPLMNCDFVAVEVGALGNTMKQSLLKSSVMMAQVAPGLTDESMAKWRLALEDPEHALRLRIYFLVARKRYDLFSFVGFGRGFDLGFALFFLASKFLWTWRSSGGSLSQSGWSGAFSALSCHRTGQEEVLRHGSYRYRGGVDGPSRVGRI